MPPIVPSIAAVTLASPMVPATRAERANFSDPRTLCLADRGSRSALARPVPPAETRREIGRAAKAVEQEEAVVALPCLPLHQLLRPCLPDPLALDLLAGLLHRLLAEQRVKT